MKRWQELDWATCEICGSSPVIALTEAEEGGFVFDGDSVLCTECASKGEVSTDGSGGADVHWREHSPATFPVNPERDAKGNAVLYPGMVRYEGVAAIFGTQDTDQFVILAPTVEGLKRALSEHGITGCLDVGACRIATLESLHNARAMPPATESDHGK